MVAPTKTKRGANDRKDANDVPSKRAKVNKKSGNANNANKAKIKKKSGNANNTNKVKSNKKSANVNNVNKAKSNKKSANANNAKAKLFTSSPNSKNKKLPGKEWTGKNPFGHEYVLGKRRTRVTYKVLYDVYLPKAKLNNVPIKSTDQKTKKTTSRLEHQWAAGNGIAGKVTQFISTKLKSKLPMNPKK